MAGTIAAHRLSAQYHGSDSFALRDVSLDVQDGEHVAILGPTGSGKTTLLQTVCGLLQSEGRCSITGLLAVNGRDILSDPPDSLFPMCALLPEDPHLLISGFVPTVRAEMGLSLRQSDLTGVERERLIDDTAVLTAIAPFLDRDPLTLSGGEAQSVALAALLVAQPDILLLDEPSTALDSERIGRVAQLIWRNLRSRTILLTDTRISLPALACERVIVMNKGHVLFDGARVEFWSVLERFSEILDLGRWNDVHRSWPHLTDSDWSRLLDSLC